MAIRRNENLWIVVEVMAGIPVSARAFACEADALVCERAVRRRMHPERDECGVFRVRMPAGSGPAK